MEKIEFYSYLKADYINSALIIYYNPLNKHIYSATLHSNTYGVITYENDNYEIHIWENEDHVHELSELSKRYTAILLNGISTDNQLKSKIINDIKALLSENSISKDTQFIINNLFQIIG